MKQMQSKSKQWPRVTDGQHRVTGTPYWVVDGRIGHGGGRGKRWFFPTKTEALAKAKLLRIERGNDGTAAIQFPTRLRAEAEDCLRRLAPFGKTLRDAVDHFIPFLEAVNNTCTAAQLVDELLKVKEADGASSRYLQDLSSRLGRFADEFDGKPVASITANEVDDWLRALAVAPTTRNNFRRVLIVMFNYAQGRGYCLTNAAKTSAKAKVVEGEVGILSVDELTRLLKSADKKIIPFLAIGAFGGLRRAELERLDWSEVDLDGGLIQVMAAKAKSAQRRFVKIEPVLAAWLTPYKRARGPVTPSNFNGLLLSARAAAKVTDWANNALRHSYASYHLAHFNDAPRLALELGHTSAHLVFQHYRQSVKPKEAARYWSIMPTKGKGPRS
jgi:integrase